MRNLPFIQFFSEKLGKPVSSFTKEDWKQAAIAAAEEFERRRLESLPPPQKKRGRPRKNTQNALRPDYTPPAPPEPPKKRGRKPAQYYGYSPEQLAQRVEAIRKIPDAPSKIRIIRDLSSILRKYAETSHDPEDIARAIRRVKEQQKADK